MVKFFGLVLLAGGLFLGGMYVARNPQQVQSKICDTTGDVLNRR